MSYTQLLSSTDPRIQSIFRSYLELRAIYDQVRQFIEPVQHVHFSEASTMNVSFNLAKSPIVSTRSAKLSF